MVKNLALSLLFVAFAWPKSAVAASELAVIDAQQILQNTAWQSLVSMQSFQPPKQRNLDGLSEQPIKIRLGLLKNSAYFKVIKDSYQIANNPILKAQELPTLEFTILPQSSDLILVDSSLQTSDHPQWEWQVSNGFQWQPAGSDHWQMVFPFALQERNANCTHNGVIKIVMDQKTKRQRGVFQIASETCAYFQYDWIGSLSVKTQTLAKQQSHSKIIQQFNQRLSNQIKTKDAKALLALYPKLELKRLLPRVAKASTVSGVVIKGTHYRLNCATRAGDYPFCDALALPSFSTAKSLFAGVILMRLQALVPGMDKLLVTKIIPECDAQKWRNVTLGDLLNMRSGIYRAKDPHADEASKDMLQFFLVQTAAEKLRLACDMFSRKSQPGKRFHYHTSDTYLAGVMFNRIFAKISDQTDVYQAIFKGEILPKLGLSPLLQKTKRTYDASRQPFTGWGMTYTADDLIKLVAFLWQQDRLSQSNLSQANTGQSNLDSQKAEQTPILNPILDSQMIHRVMHPQIASAARDAGSPNMRYNHGFWALEVSQSLDCQAPRWLPFMSGFGGISVVMISPDILYYNFSDNYRFEWLYAIRALNKVMDLCG